MASFLWRALGAVTGNRGIPGFDYDIGNPNFVWESAGVNWEVKMGTKRDVVDSSVTGATGGAAPKAADVSIFQAPVALSGDASTSAGSTMTTLSLLPAGVARDALVRNAIKYGKTLRLPGVLRCDDAVEYSGVVYMATESCMTLKEVLLDGALGEFYGGEDKTLEGIAFGLRCVANALAMMHKNGLAHGNVNVDTIMLLPSGEWRLFGHECVGQIADESPLFRKCGTAWMLEHRRPPELTGTSPITSSATACLQDSWGLACLVYECFLLHGCQSSGADRRSLLTRITAHDLKAGRCVPRALHSAFTGLVNANLKTRWSVQKFVDDCDFFNDSPFVTMMQQLEELQLKDSVERDHFYRHFAKSCEHFPVNACRYLVLPKLTHAVQYGGASAAALEPILQVGAKLDPAEFGQLVSPAVVSLFASPDHLVRYHLLSSASQYAALLPAALVNERIWQYYATGFSHRTAEIRELSVRSLVQFAPQLSEKLLSTDVPNHLFQCQQDREASIRTNATLCLGMIAKYLPSASRLKILVTGFGRMLKDPFPPSRVAAVNSIATCAEYFPERAVADSIIPALSPLLVDAEATVRESTLQAVHALLRRVEVYAATLPLTAAPPVTTADTAPAVASPIPAAKDSTSSTTNDATPATPSSSIWKQWFLGTPSNDLAAAAPPAAGGPMPSNASRTDPDSTSSTTRPPAGRTTATVATADVTGARSATAADDGWASMDEDAAANSGWAATASRTPKSAHAMPVGHAAAGDRGSARVDEEAMPTRAVAPAAGPITGSAAGPMKLGLGSRKKGLGASAAKVE